MNYDLENQLKGNQKPRVCEICGRSHNKTKLNFEGVIHHNTRLICIDTKSCQRIAKKKRKS